MARLPSCSLVPGSQPHRCSWFIRSPHDALQLEVENRGVSAMKTTQALHAYYAVSDIGSASISGLHDVAYYDNADGRKRKEGTPGQVTISGETDRLYSGVGAPPGHRACACSHC